MSDMARDMTHRLRVWAAEELVRKGRQDLLEKMANGDVQAIENADGSLTYLVAGEPVLSNIRITPTGSIVH